MSTSWGIVVSIVAIAVGGTLLAVLWAQVQRRIGIHAVERPREDEDLQMHQAVSRSQINP